MTSTALDRSTGAVLPSARRILIADDAVSSRELLRTILERQGYIVMEAVDGREAVDQAPQFAPDLVILDLQMPAFDGFQVMKALRETEDKDGLFILVTSAEPGHKMRSLQAGAKDFVSKPFQIPDLITRIHALLRMKSEGETADGEVATSKAAVQH